MLMRTTSVVPSSPRPTSHTRSDVLALPSAFWYASSRCASGGAPDGSTGCAAPAAAPKVEAPPDGCPNPPKLDKVDIAGRAVAPNAGAPKVPVVVVVDVVPVVPGKPNISPPVSGLAPPPVAPKRPKPVDPAVPITPRQGWLAL